MITWTSKTTTCAKVTVEALQQNLSTVTFRSVVSFGFDFFSSDYFVMVRLKLEPTLGNKNKTKRGV